MDFVATFSTGFVMVLGGVVGGLPFVYIGYVWLKRRLFSAFLSQLQGFLDDLARYPEAYEDLTAPLMAGATNAIGRAFSMLAADVQKNPDKYAAILKPVFAKAVKELTSGGGGIPRMKWQDILGMGAMQLFQRWMAGGQAEGVKKLAEVATEANPFA